MSVNKNIVTNDAAEMNKALFSQKHYKVALDIAAKAHGAQKTPHGYPYVVHVTSVAMEVMAAIGVDKTPYDEANLAIQCALLHDVLEDTAMSEEQLRQSDGLDPGVVEGVKALTKDTGLPSKAAQMQDSLKRLQQQPEAVQMVKLADRITNLGLPPKHWNREKKMAYQEEAKSILKALDGASDYLARNLQQHIDRYEAYIKTDTAI